MKPTEDAGFPLEAARALGARLTRMDQLERDPSSGLLLLGLIAISLTLSGLVPPFSGLIEDASSLTHRLLVAK